MFFDAVRKGRTALKSMYFDEGGGIAIWFGLLLVPLVIIGGAAVDLSSNFNRQTQMQGGC